MAVNTVSKWTGQLDGVMAMQSRSNFHMLTTEEFDGFMKSYIETKNYHLFDIGAGNGGVTKTWCLFFEVFQLGGNITICYSG